MDALDTPLILADALACNRLKRFLEKLCPTIQFLQCDSVHDAVKGAVAFFPVTGDKEEPSLWFGWRYAQPAKKTVEVAEDKTAETLNRCLDDRDWIPDDDPKRLRLGFVNYQQSTWLQFKMSDVKKACAADPVLDAKLHALNEAKARLFKEWQAKVKETKEAKG